MPFLPFSLLPLLLFQVFHQQAVDVYCICYKTHPDIMLFAANAFSFLKRQAPATFQQCSTGVQDLNTKLTTFNDAVKNTYKCILPVVH